MVKLVVNQVLKMPKLVKQTITPTTKYTLTGVVFDHTYTRKYTFMSDTGITRHYIAKCESEKLILLEIFQNTGLWDYQVIYIPDIPDNNLYIPALCDVGLEKCPYDIQSNVLQVFYKLNLGCLLAKMVCNFRFYKIEHNPLFLKLKILVSKNLQILF